MMNKAELKEYCRLMETGEYEHKTAEMLSEFVEEKGE